MIDIIVVDLAGAGESRGREKAAASIGDACAKHGFFFVANHGVSESLVRRVFSESERFHRLPLALAHLRQQGVEFRALSSCQQSLNSLVRALSLPIFLVRRGQRKARLVIHRLQLRGPLKVGDCLLRLGRAQQFLPNFQVLHKTVSRNFGQFSNSALCSRSVFLR